MSSKIIPATCALSIVTADGVPVVGANILSQGVGASSGILGIDEDRSVYITSNATDIAAAIQNVNSLLTNVIAILTAHDAVTLAPGASAAEIAALTAANVTFLATKEALK